MKPGMRLCLARASLELGEIFYNAMYAGRAPISNVGVAGGTVPILLVESQQFTWVLLTACFPHSVLQMGSVPVLAKRQGMACWRRRTGATVTPPGVGGVDAVIFGWLGVRGDDTSLGTKIEMEGPSTNSRKINGVDGASINARAEQWTYMPYRCGSRVVYESVDQRIKYYFRKKFEVYETNDSRTKYRSLR